MGHVLWDTLYKESRNVEECSCCQVQPSRLYLLGCFWSPLPLCLFSNPTLQGHKYFNNQYQFMLFYLAQAIFGSGQSNVSINCSVLSSSTYLFHHIPVWLGFSVSYFAFWSVLICNFGGSWWIFQKYSFYSKFYLLFPGKIWKVYSLQNLS